MKSKLLTGLLLCLLFAACKEVTFETPQPKGKRVLKDIPRNLRGKYLPVTENGDLSKDTIIVTANGYHFGYFDPADRAKKNEAYEEGILNDTLVLKSYKGYYFLNLYEKPEWLLRVIRREKNGDLIYMTLEEKGTDFNDFLNKLSIEIAIDSTQLENKTLYQIDPSPSKLIELIDKGFFTETRLTRIKENR